MSQDLIGQVFLVTGATEGIGKAACLDFAKRGATLVLVGRNKSKTENVVADLERLSQNARISYLLGDLSSIQATKSIAKAFREKHKELHVLVNNAGAFFPRYQTSAEGYEMTFALNHLAYFVLTTSLLDILQNTRHSRIVNTASDAHLFAHLNVDTVAKRDGKHAGWRAYGDSKLANILFTRSLAKKLPPHTTIANCFHPGYVSSQFGLDQRFRVLSLAAKVNAQILAEAQRKAQRRSSGSRRAQNRAPSMANIFTIARSIARRRAPKTQSSRKRYGSSAKSFAPELRQVSRVLRDFELEARGEGR